MEHRLGIKIGDVILMAGISIAALLLFLFPFFSYKAEYAEIVIVETGEAKTVALNLNEEYELSSRGYKLKICVENGKIFVAQSDCRDGICVNTPPISRSGQSIVCAPAGVVIRIVGEEAVVDGVSG